MLRQTPRPMWLICHHRKTPLPTSTQMRRPPKECATAAIVWFAGPRRAVFAFHQSGFAAALSSERGLSEIGSADVVLSLGEPDEFTFDASSPNEVAAILARYDLDLNVVDATPISSYPGAPRDVGHARPRAIAIDPSGDVVVAGSMQGSVQFGAQTWSTVAPDPNHPTDAFVVRVSNDQIQPLFRVVASTANDHVSVHQLAAFDGAFALSGPAPGSAEFANATTVARITGLNEYVAYTDDGGAAQWIGLLPRNARIEPIGDRFLLYFETAGSGFTLDGTDYSGSDMPAEGVIAMLTADGTVDWMHRIEGSSFAFLGGTATAQDLIVVAYSGVDETFLNVPAQPDTAGRAHLLGLDTNGGLLWNVAIDDISYHGVAVDQAGIAWTVTPCGPGPYAPRRSPALPEIPCEALEYGSYLLGFSTTDGVLDYAYRVTHGAVEPEILGVMGGSSVVLRAISLEPFQIMPDTPDERTVTPQIDVFTQAIMVFE